MKKLLLAAALLGAALVPVLVSVEPADERPRVETRTVAPRHFVASVEASGVVRPGESVDISAEVVGPILEVTVRPGDPVEPGQVMELILPLGAPPLLAFAGAFVFSVSVGVVFGIYPAAIAAHQHPWQALRSE